MKTFLQRKILRAKESAENQKKKASLIDEKIERHYEAIKQLKAAQKKRENLASHLYSSIGYLLLRLSKEEKLTLFKD